MGRKLIDVWAVSVGCLPETSPIMIRREDGVPGGLGNWNEARESFLEELWDALNVYLDSDAADAAFNVAERACPVVAPVRGYSFPVGMHRMVSVTPETVTEDEFLGCGGLEAELDA